MKTMELNKLAAAVLLGLLLFSGVNFLGNLLGGHGELETLAYAPPAQDGDGGAVVVEEPKGPEPIEALLASADLGAGERVYRRCASCHDIEQSGSNKVGPKLWNIVGKDKGAVDGYNYSNALSAMEGVWGYAELNAFLYKPKEYVPGTKMGFNGLSKTADRANLIAWMRDYADSPLPLPAAE